jgi:DNA-directed RNA polymerase subunit M/transcription elongation factor TFIIS
MSDDLRDQIYNNMNMKDTDELLDIWQTNNRFEWTAMAFDAVRQILQNRIGQLPEQNEPVYKEETEDDTEDEEDKEATDQDENSEPFDPDDADLACPRCRSTELVTGQLNSGQKLYFEDQEVTAIACQNCGFVFMMLKSFME